MKEASTTSSGGSSRSRTGGERHASLGKRVLKWAIFVAALLFFFSVLREAVDPYGDQPYVEITHGDHVHYVPKNRDPNVPVGKFPTRAPGPNEEITPEGRIVEKAPQPGRREGPEPE